MSNTLSVFRTEKKYPISKLKKYALIDRLSLIAPFDSNSGINGYQVRSLYFDSVLDDDYMDKLDGLENRKKIRLRLYDPHQETLKLELKQKQGAVQLKKSIWISRELALQLLQGDYFGLLDLNNPAATEIYTIMALGAYRPKCIIEYHRIAFAEDTNNIRITFDSEIAASKNTDAFFDEAVNYVPVADDLLEVKYNGFLLSPFKQILNLADTPEISSSKYAQSRELIG